MFSSNIYVIKIVLAINIIIRDMDLHDISRTCINNGMNKLPLSNQNAKVEGYCLPLTKILASAIHTVTRKHESD